MKMGGYAGGVQASILLGMVVLFGKENRYWEYFETDPAWWTVRLWTRRN